MKLKELIERLDSTPHPGVSGDEEDFYEELGLDYSGRFWLGDHGYTHRAISPWLCTDTFVGSYAIYLDGAPVATSFQEGRKCNTSYWWVSKTHHRMVVEHVLHLKQKLDGSADGEPPIRLLNLDEDIGDAAFEQTYSGSLLVDHVLYQGELVKVVKKFDNYNEIKDWTNVVIHYQGRDIKVPMSKVRVPAKLREP